MRAYLLGRKRSSWRLGAEVLLASNHSTDTSAPAPPGHSHPSCLIHTPHASSYPLTLPLHRPGQLLLHRGLPHAGRRHQEGPLGRHPLHITSSHFTLHLSHISHHTSTHHMAHRMADPLGRRAGLSLHQEGHRRLRSVHGHEQRARGGVPYRRLGAVMAR